MDRNPLEIDAVGQKVVDAHGAGTFEGVAGREDTELPFQSGEVVGSASIRSGSMAPSTIV